MSCWKILHRFQVANAQRKAVLDSAADISIIATNKKGVISVFNTGAEKLLRYSAEELIGKATPRIFHLDSELEMLSKKLYSKYGSTRSNVCTSGKTALNFRSE